MARLIDADTLIAILEKIADEDGMKYFHLDEITQEIFDAPTVDAVPVVRCKDCQYWNPRYETMGICMKHNSIVTFTKPDFYCAWGERKQK